MCGDEFSLRYSDLVTGSYDCVDRIVLNAFFPELIRRRAEGSRRGDGARPNGQPVTR